MTRVRQLAGRTAVPAFLATLVMGCLGRPAEPREYTLHGQILAVGLDTSEVLITHEDIKGFMPGMTMPFKVRDAALLEGKTAGDLVTARLMVTDTEAWLAALETTGRAPLPEPMTALPPFAGADRLSPGSPAPDTVLTDPRDAPLSLSDWRDAAVAVTFIYTRCPLPQFCPRMDRRFAELQQLILADPILRGRSRLLSVSFDPETDTPDVLRAHAAALGANPAVWSFATAPADTVDRFAADFGVTVIREDDRTITHNLRTAVIGPDGRIVSIHDGNQWTAAALAVEMRRALEGGGESPALSAR